MLCYWGVDGCTAILEFDSLVAAGGYTYPHVPFRSLACGCRGLSWSTVGCVYNYLFRVQVDSCGI